MIVPRPKRSKTRLCSRYWTARCAWSRAPRARYAALRWASLALATLLAISWTHAAQAASRNIVLVVTDDQGADFGAYGNPIMHTPHMDRLAQEGIRFDHAFCTTASCSASRSVLLTGLHNHANGQYGHQHAYHKFASYRDILSLPVLLAARGYRTARVGKFHVAPPDVYHFDTVLAASSRHPVRMAEACRAFLLEEGEQPFFLYFCTSDPHRSGGTADELPHRPNRFGNLPHGKSRPGIRRVEYDPADVVVPSFLPDSPTSRAELAQYYTSCSRIDQGLGRLMQILKQSDHWAETLLVYLSDHGIAMPGAKTNLYDPGMRCPLLVRHPQGRGRGTVSPAMISWVDITPTLLDFAGALDRETQTVLPEVLRAARRADSGGSGRPSSSTEPGHFQGRSFLSLLDNPQAMGWDEVYASHTFHEITMYYPMRAVRTRRYKLIWNIAHELPFPFASDLWRAPTWQAQYRQGPQASYGPWTVQSYIDRPEFELFDLEADPDESQSLADDPKYAKLLATMKRKLRAFQQRTDDPWILKWDYE